MHFECILIHVVYFVDRKCAMERRKAYDATPLCSVGKLVRVTFQGQLRRAMVECVEESTVDVALVGKHCGKQQEATVPMSCVRTGR